MAILSVENVTLERGGKRYPPRLFQYAPGQLEQR